MRHSSGDIREDLQLEMLFAIPIGVKMSSGFEKTHEKILLENYTNDSISDNKFILEQYDELKQWILSEVQQYAKKAMACVEPLRITQSWSIRSNDNLQFHQHPNSIVSGAYYVDAEDISSRLTLMSPHNRQLKWNTEYSLLQQQDWNWDVVTFNPEVGKLILFPSYLGHGVNSTGGQIKRCVVSFNTWFENPMGSVDSLTYLD